MLLNKDILLKKELILNKIRKFFNKNNFHEFDVPVLNTMLPLEPNIYSFETKWRTNDGNKTLYLSTSPESALKKYFSIGFNKCFAIGKSFRNLEDSGNIHRPEFLMLEWYRDNADYNNIIDDTKKLLLFLSNYLSLKPGFIGRVSLKDDILELSMDQLFQKHVGISFKDLYEDIYMQKFCRDIGYNVENSTWEQLFNQLFLNKVEPNIPKDKIIFLKDYPARISPLAKVSEIDNKIAERFEFYINGIEIGNGCSEPLNADKVLENFNKELVYRKNNKKHIHKIDTLLIESIRNTKVISMAGIGVGVDRLLMTFLGILNIDDTLLDL